MKGKSKFLLILFVVFSLLCLVSCNSGSQDSSGDDDVSDTGVFDTDGSNQEENDDNKDEENQPTEITIETLNAVVFADKTVDYDGEKHSIYVETLPDGVSVKYSNNGKSMPGTYTVKAVLTYENLKVEKKAVLTISKLKSVLTADEVQSAHLYGGDVYPKYTLNNTQQVRTHTLVRPYLFVSTSHPFQTI